MTRGSKQHMGHFLLILAFLIVCIAAPQVQADQPASLVLEAEDFAPAPGSAWKSIKYGENYFWDAIGNSYISGEKLLSAPERCKPSTARLTAQIPADGRYKVWVHFEAPKDYNMCFGLSVEQNGRKVLDAQMGGADQVKLWPLGWGYKAQVDPYYGGGDNVCWQGAEVDLKAGDAVFTLQTLDNPEPAAKRNIDVLYLTTDLSDTLRNKTDPFLDELSQPGRLWVRIKNDGKVPMRPSARARINRRNWSASDFMVKRSGIESLGKEIAPGAYSDWVDIGSVCDKIHGTSFEISPGVPGDTAFEAEVEMAHSPDAGERWTYKWRQEERPLYVWVPVDLDLKSIVSSEQIRERIEGYLGGLPQGPAPKKIVFVDAMMGPGEPKGAHAKWVDVFYKLGYTSPMGNPNRDEAEWQRVLGGDMTRKGIGTEHLDRNEKPADLLKRLSADGFAASRKHLAAYSVGDEINLGSYSSGNDEEFRTRLKSMGFTPEQLGVKDWSEASSVGDERAFEYPILYIEGKKYSAETSIRRLAEITKAITEAFGRNVPVAANYAPHPAFLPDEWQWVDVFKYGGLTMPWSEDYQWQVPVISMQIVGYTLDVMRCAAKYHDLPIQYYCMPHSPGNTDRDFRLSNYLALGRGVKYINHFTIGPQLFCTENYVDWRDASRYREIHRIIREAGKVDDLLYAGKPPKAEVAVMLCRYTDVWEKFGPADASSKRKNDWTYNAYGVERQGVWLALKHLQAPVDLITDPDVCDGRLSQYKVLYLAGTHISRQSAEKIRDWVQSGGVLVSSAAGGLYDEYNRPLDTLLPVYGIESHEFTQHDWLIRPKQELIRLKPMDTVVGVSGFPLRSNPETPSKPFQMESLAVVDRVKPLASAKVMGTFSDGSAAVVKNRFGKGCAYLVNTMPGLAYQKKALPVRPYDRNEFSHFLPVDYSKDVRALLSEPLEQAKVTKRAECSEPLVEGDMLESAQGVVISLANFSGKPLKDLVVKVRPGRKVSKVWSVRQGTLSYQSKPGLVEVRMPLDVSDFLVLE